MDTSQNNINIEEEAIQESFGIPEVDALVDSGNESDIFIYTEGINSYGYGIIAKAVMCNFHLSKNARLVYGVLSSWGANGIGAFLSLEKILKLVSMSKKTFYNARRELVDAGVITVTTRYRKNGGRAPSVYQFATDCELPLDVIKELLSEEQFNYYMQEMKPNITRHASQAQAEFSTTQNPRSEHRSKNYTNALNRENNSFAPGNVEKFSTEDETGGHRSKIYTGGSGKNYTYLTPQNPRSAHEENFPINTTLINTHTNPSIQESSRLIDSTNEANAAPTQPQPPLPQSDGRTDFEIEGLSAQPANQLDSLLAAAIPASSAVEPVSVEEELPQVKPEPVIEAVEQSSPVSADYDETFLKICDTTVNRNLIDTPSGKDATFGAYQTLISEGYNPEDIALAWAEHQVAASQIVSGDRFMPQLKKWLEDQGQTGARNEISRIQSDRKASGKKQRSIEFSKAVTTNATLAELVGVAQSLEDELTYGNVAQHDVDNAWAAAWAYFDQTQAQ